MISPTALQEFKRIYEAEFGERLSDEQAMERALNLLLLFRTIYRPREDEAEPSASSEQAEGGPP